MEANERHRVMVVVGLSDWRPQVWCLILPVLLFALIFGAIEVIIGFAVAADGTGRTSSRLTKGPGKDTRPATT